MLVNGLTQTAEQASTSVRIKSHYRLGPNGQVSLYPFPLLHNSMPVDIPAPLDPVLKVMKRVGVCGLGERRDEA